MVTGVDLVKSQILVAGGQEAGRDSDASGGSSAGTRSSAASTPSIPRRSCRRRERITGLNLPGGAGIRVDTAAYQDGVISPYYDSLVAKLIAYGSDRAEAIARMQRALGMFVVEGIYTSIPLHQRILKHPEFIAGKIDTGFLLRHGFLGDKK